MRFDRERSRGLWVRVGAACFVVVSAACGETPTGMSGPECPGGALCLATGGVGGMMVTGGASGMVATGGMGGMPDAGMEPPLIGPASTACAPTGPTMMALGGNRTVLYSGPEELRGLARRSDALFAMDATGIARLSDGGASLERVATVQADGFWAADLRLYWIDNASVYRTAFAANDEPPDLVAMGLLEPATLLQNDEENLYYAHALTQSVWQQPIDGSAPTQIVTGAVVEAMELHGGSLFYSTGASGIDKVLVEGGEAEAFVTVAPRPVIQLDNDGISLVWIDGTEVLSASASGNEVIDSAEVIAALSQGGPTRSGPTQSGTARSRITLFVRQGQDVYFADEAGSVGHVNVSAPAGCALLVQHAGEIRGLAVEDDALYVNVRTQAMSELWRFTL